MAKKKNKKPSNPLIGVQAKPVVLDSTTKLDIDTNKKIIDNILEASISNNLNMAEIENFTSISNARDQIYQLIDTMMKDSAVSSIVRTYAEDSCEVADNGHIIWCESKDPNISKFINYLLNVMNIDKNIYGWAYSLVKYGDVYLRLYRESDYKDPIFKKDNIEHSFTAKTALNESFDDPKEDKDLNEAVYLSIHKSNDPYSYYIEMVPDPSTMFELTKFGKTYGYIETPNTMNDVNYLSNYLGTSSAAGAYNYKMKSNDVNIYQADDFVHAFLADDTDRFPEKVDIFLTEDEYKSGKNPQSYTVKRGKSMLYDSYKIWREKSLLENAVILNRITRSSVVRTVQVEVGDMSKTQSQQALQRIKSLMEQKSAINTGESMSEYTNPGPIENNIYLATHDGKGAVTIGTVGGDVDVKNIADLDYWNNKYYSSYGVPKQYYGWCLGKDTELLLLDGTKHTIEELYNNKEQYINKGILGCNQDGSLCPTKITNIMLTNEHAQLIRIWLDNGNYVDVTPDHKMMLRNGTFIEAKDIKVNDSLMPYYDNNIDKINAIPLRLVTKIEYLSVDNPVYDITVADDCHTFALACGIFVHNCDDGAGFNGGSSLTILSSIYAKGVKRVQNALIQAITDAINLILINKGCKSYLNNFVLKMKAPSTQEEKDYRESLGNKVNTISNMQSLFSEVEDKVNKLEILKTLVSTLNYGDELTSIIDKEIANVETQKKEEEKQAEEEAKQQAAVEAPEESQEENNDMDLNLDMADVPTNEAVENNSPDILVEGKDFLGSDELPIPEELNSKKDFTRNE